MNDLTFQRWIGIFIGAIVGFATFLISAVIVPDDMPTLGKMIFAAVFLMLSIYVYYGVPVE